MDIKNTSENQKIELQIRHIITPYNTCLDTEKNQTPRKCFRNNQMPRYWYKNILEISSA